MRTYSRIAGTGSFLPPRRLTNADLVALLAQRGVETTDEWIVERTGIRARHYADDGMNASDLALQASLAALQAADCTAADVDLIIVATSTPDMVFPSTATILQRKLTEAALAAGQARGPAGCPAFDVQAVCSGFIYALTVADAMIANGTATRALVIGSEVFSRLLDFDDRGTCVLFGDGAGAVVVERGEGDGTAADRGILASDLNSDGRFRDILYVDGGVSTQTTGHLRMHGKEVFRHAVEKLAETAHRSLDKAGLKPGDVDWIVPHQANLRIIKATAQKMDVDLSHVVITVQDHGNTSAASIPLALSVANLRGQIKPGDLVVVEAIGGGLAWGSVVFRR